MAGWFVPLLKWSKESFHSECEVLRVKMSSRIGVRKVSDLLLMTNHGVVEMAQKVELARLIYIEG